MEEPENKQPRGTRGKPGRPRTDEGGPSRERRIREAAVTVFASKGFHNARISDIAKEAGVAHGLVYHYFNGKDQLLADVFHRTWRHLETGLTSVAHDEDASSAEKLSAIVRLMLGSYRLAPDLVRVVVLEVTRSGHLRSKVSQVTQVFEVIEQIITDGQSQGEIRSDISARLISYVFWGAIDEVLTGWVFGTLPSADEDIASAEQAVVAIVLGGVLTT